MPSSTAVAEKEAAADVETEAKSAVTTADAHSVAQSHRWSACGVSNMLLEISSLNRTLAETNACQCTAEPEPSTDGRATLAMPALPCVSMPSGGDKAAWCQVCSSSLRVQSIDSWTPACLKPNSIFCAMAGNGPVRGHSEKNTI